MVRERLIDRNREGEEGKLKKSWEQTSKNIQKKYNIEKKVGIANLALECPMDWDVEEAAWDSGSTFLASSNRLLSRLSYRQKKSKKHVFDIKNNDLLSFYFQVVKSTNFERHYSF